MNGAGYVKTVLRYLRANGLRSRHVSVFSMFLVGAASAAIVLAGTSADAAKTKGAESHDSAPC